MAAEDNPADDRYQLDLASGALADIAFSVDLTLEGCRNKARHAYEKINPPETK